MTQQVLIRGKKDGVEIPVLVDNDGKIETTATLVGDITIGDVTVSNFPATQTVDGTVVVSDVEGGIIDTVDEINTLNTIVNKVNVDTVDHISEIDSVVDMTQVDGYGFEAELTPQGEQRVVEPVRLAGTAFNGATLDTNFWTAVTGTGGSAGQANGLLTISSGTTSNNAVTLTSFRQGIFIPGSTNRYRSNIISTAGNANCIRRWGAYDDNNGFFFQLDGTTASIVSRKGASDTAVAQVDWNGVNSHVFGDDLCTFEIYWTGKKVYFVIDDVVVHTLTATTTALVATTTLPVRAEVRNTNGSTTSRSLVASTMAIHRLGMLRTAPMTKFISGATTSVLKYNPGTLQRIIFTPGANGNTLILYDATSATNELMKVGGANTAGVTVSFEVGGQFYTGLYVAMTGASSTATIVYE